MQKISLLGILQLISQIEYCKTRRELTIIALIALSHKDTEVRDYTLQCFEKWNRLCFVDNATPMPEAWLEEYRLKARTYELEEEKEMQSTGIEAKSIDLVNKAMKRTKDFKVEVFSKDKKHWIEEN